MTDSGGHARWERTGARRHDAAYDEARAALLLGQMVYDRRAALGLTQAELAARTGMTQPQLSRLESGGATPAVLLLARLARVLDAELGISFRPAARQGGLPGKPGVYGNRSGALPPQPEGYQTESDVWPGPEPRGTERPGEVWYAPDHYGTFWPWPW